MKTCSVQVKNASIADIATHSAFCLISTAGYEMCPSAYFFFDLLVFFQFSIFDERVVEARKVAISVKKNIAMINYVEFRLFCNYKQ
jgi:hypothetical protein